MEHPWVFGPRTTPSCPEGPRLRRVRSYRAMATHPMKAGGETDSLKPALWKLTQRAQKCDHKSQRLQPESQKWKNCSEGLGFETPWLQVS